MNLSSPQNYYSGSGISVAQEFYRVNGLLDAVKSVQQALKLEDIQSNFRCAKQQHLGYVLDTLLEIDTQLSLARPMADVLRKILPTIEHEVPFVLVGTETSCVGYEVHFPYTSRLELDCVELELEKLGYIVDSNLLDIPSRIAPGSLGVRYLLPYNAEYQAHFEYVFHKLYEAVLSD